MVKCTWIIFLLLIIVSIIIVTFFSTREFLIEKYRTEISKIEKGRIIAMKGYENEKYIPFSYHRKLFYLLKDLIEILDNNKIPYFLFSGALIGYTRHNKGFIPWDDDVDICVDFKYREKLLKLNIDNYFFSNDEICKFTKGEKYISDNNTFIDIFFMSENEKHQYKYSYPSNRTLWPREYFDNMKELLPLKEGKFKLYFPDGSIADSISINIPNKYKTVLSRAYPGYDKVCKSQSNHNSFFNYFYNNFQRTI